MNDGFHILVVDDDSVACDLLREILSTEGYRVKTALNGDDALVKIRRNGFHLMITDLFMPGLDGLELLIRAKSLFPHLKVILLTASREERVIDEALRQGAYVVISKPLGQTEILKIVNEILHRQENSTPESGGFSALKFRKKKERKA